MADNTTKNTAGATNTAGVKHELSYDDKVIEKIVGLSTDGIPGVLTMTGGVLGGLNNRLHVTDQQTAGIDAEVGKKQVALDLNVIVEYGQYVPQVFDQIIAKVQKAVKEMTGLEVVEVNMHVSDVMNREDFQQAVQQQKQKNFQNNKDDNQQVPQQPATQYSGTYSENPRVQ